MQKKKEEELFLLVLSATYLFSLFPSAILSYYLILFSYFGQFFLFCLCVFFVCLHLNFIILIPLWLYSMYFPLLKCINPPPTRHINPHPPLLPPSPPSCFLLLIFPWSLPLFISIIPTLGFCSSFLPCYCFMSLYLSVTSSYTLTEQRTGDPPSCLPPVLGYSFALSPVRWWMFSSLIL